MAVVRQVQYYACCQNKIGGEVRSAQETSQDFPNAERLPEMSAEEVKGISILWWRI